MKKSMTFVLFVVTMLFFITPYASAVVIFEDGQEHTLDYTIDDFVEVRDGGPRGLEVPTTLNVVTNGQVLALLNCWDNSIVNVFDGFLNGAAGRENSHINVFGGEIRELLGDNNSQITVSSGTVNTGIWTYDQSYAEVSGGLIPSVLVADDDSSIHLSGGVIDYWLKTRGNSEITIYGSGFNYSYGSIPVSSGHLTGTLANGDPIDNDFHIYDNASIILIPEPATLLLLGFGAVIVRKTSKYNK